MKEEEGWKVKTYKRKRERNDFKNLTYQNLHKFFFSKLVFANSDSQDFYLEKYSFSSDAYNV